MSSLSYNDPALLELIRLVRTERDKKLGFSQIHTKLLQQGIPEEHIRAAIKHVDNEELKRLKRTATRDSYFDKMLFGGIAILVGIFITLITYSQANKHVGTYFVAYGPILGGFYYFRTGWVNYQRLKKRD